MKYGVKRWIYGYDIVLETSSKRVQFKEFRNEGRYVWNYTLRTE